MEESFTLTLVPSENDVKLAVLKVTNNDGKFSHEVLPYDQDTISKIPSSGYRDILRTFVCLFFKTDKPGILSLADSFYALENAIQLGRELSLWLYDIWQNSYHTGDSFPCFIKNVHNHKKENRSKASYRKRLGWSPNKLRVVKRFCYPWAVNASNRVFDDDVDLLCQINKPEVARTVIKAKILNPSLKYAKVIRYMMESSLCNVWRMAPSGQADILLRIIQEHEEVQAEFGSDIKFRLPKPYARGYYTKAVECPKEELEGYFLLPLSRAKKIEYALAMTNGFGPAEIENAIKSGSFFYLAINKETKEMLMYETRNGVPIRARRNRKEVNI